jgi:hypothetical protein
MLMVVSKSDRLLGLLRRSPALAADMAFVQTTLWQAPMAVTKIDELVDLLRLGPALAVDVVSMQFLLWFVLTSAMIVPIWLWYLVWFARLKPKPIQNKRNRHNYVRLWQRATSNRRRFDGRYLRRRARRTLEERAEASQRRRETAQAAHATTAGAPQQAHSASADTTGSQGTEAAVRLLGGGGSSQCAAFPYGAEVSVEWMPHSNGGMTFVWAGHATRVGQERLVGFKYQLCDGEWSEISRGSVMEWTFKQEAGGWVSSGGVLVSVSRLASPPWKPGASLKRSDDRTDEETSPDRRTGNRCEDTETRFKSRHGLERDPETPSHAATPTQNPASQPETPSPRAKDEKAPPEKVASGEEKEARCQTPTRERASAPVDPHTPLSKAETPKQSPKSQRNKHKSATIAPSSHKATSHAASTPAKAEDKLKAAARDKRCAARTAEQKARMAQEQADRQRAADDAATAYAQAVAEEEAAVFTAKEEERAARLEEERRLKLELERFYEEVNSSRQQVLDEEHKNTESLFIESAAIATRLDEEEQRRRQEEEDLFSATQHTPVSGRTRSRNERSKNAASPIGRQTTVFARSENAQEEIRRHRQESDRRLTAATAAAATAAIIAAQEANQQVLAAQEEQRVARLEQIRRIAGELNQLPNDESSARQQGWEDEQDESELLFIANADIAQRLATEEQLLREEEYDIFSASPSPSRRSNDGGGKESNRFKALGRAEKAGNSSPIGLKTKTRGDNAQAELQRVRKERDLRAQGAVAVVAKADMEKAAQLTTVGSNEETKRLELEQEELRMRTILFQWARAVEQLIAGTPHALRLFDSDDEQEVLGRGNEASPIDVDALRAQQLKGVGRPKQQPWSDTVAKKGQKPKLNGLGVGCWYFASDDLIRHYERLNPAVKEVSQLFVPAAVDGTGDTCDWVYNFYKVAAVDHALMNIQCGNLAHSDGNGKNEVDANTRLRRQQGGLGGLEVLPAIIMARTIKPTDLEEIMKHYTVHAATVHESHPTSEHLAHFRYARPDDTAADSMVAFNDRGSVVAGWETFLANPSKFLGKPATLDLILIDIKATDRHTTTAALNLRLRVFDAAAAVKTKVKKVKSGESKNKDDSDEERTATPAGSQWSRHGVDGAFFWARGAIRQITQTLCPQLRNAMELATVFDPIGGLLAFPQRLQQPQQRRRTTLIKQLQAVEPVQPATVQKSFRSRTDEDLKQARVRRAVAAARAGHLSRAVNIIMSASEEKRKGDAAVRALAPEVCVAELKKLHPNAPADTRRCNIDVDPLRIVISVEEVRVAAKRMARGEAPGGSGLSSDILHQVLAEEEKHGGTVMAERVAEVVRRSLAGDLTTDEKEALTTVKLIILSKPKGGLRPVGMGETLTKLAALVAMQRAPDAGTTWKQQYGLRKGGVESAVLRVRGLLRSGKRVIALDAGNAYNSLRRDTFMPILADPIRASKLLGVRPEQVHLLAAYAKLAYGDETAAFYDDGEKLHRIPIRTGVRQGCPAAPWFFCIALQELLEVTEKKYGVDIIGFLDDVTVCGESKAAEAAAIYFTSEAKVLLGLVFHVEQDSERVEMKGGLRILGAAVASDPVKAAALLNVIRPLGTYADFTAALEDFAPDLRTRLMRVCGISQAGFVARCHGEEAAEWLGGFDGLTVAFLSRHIGVRADAVSKNPKVYLPTDMGGLGFTMWRPLAPLCLRAAASEEHQNVLVTAYYEKKDNAPRLSKAQKNAKAWIEEPRATEATAPVHHDMLRTQLQIPFVPRRLATATVNCPGCHRKFTANDLERHATECVCWQGAGNPTRRHTVAKNSIVSGLRNRGLSVMAEVPVGPGCVMDAICGRRWIDFTVTRHEEDRIRVKHAKYKALAEAAGATFEVLAFNAFGAVQPKSRRVAAALATSARTTVRDLFADSSAHICAFSAQARRKAATFAVQADLSGLLTKAVSVATAAVVAAVKSSTAVAVAPEAAPLVPTSQSSGQPITTPILLKEQVGTDDEEMGEWSEPEDRDSSDDSEGDVEE